MKNSTTLARWLHPLPMRLWKPYIAAVLCMAFFFSPLAGFSQTNPLSGRITDDKGQPIPGATVVLKGTNSGTVTDERGDFKLNAPANAVLVISSVGFTSTEVPVNRRDNIQVSLSSGSKGLDEVIVVGYGTQRRANVTGAIVSLKAAEIEKAPMSNPIEALRGQLPGLRVTRADGQPGSDVQFTIRGNRSLTASNQPLVVVDGLPIGGNLSEFNPSDIESIEVLKDAAAAAIYGARGANGVVLITTKRGKDGQTNVTFEASYGIKDLTSHLNVFNAQEFLQLRQEAARGVDGTPLPSAPENVLDAIELANYKAGKSVDWQDVLLRTGKVQNYNLSVNGGGKQFHIFFSGNAYKETGIAQASSYDRYSMRTNVDYTPKDWVKIGANLQGTQTYADETGQALDQDNVPDFQDWVGNSPLGRTHDENGNLVLYASSDLFQFNPLFRYQESKRERWTSRVLINPFVEIQLLKGLKYRINGALENRTERYGGFTSRKYNDGAPNFARQEQGEGRTLLLDNILSYEKTIADKHHFNVTAVYEAQSFKSNYVFIQSRNFPTDELGYYAAPQGTDNRELGNSSQEWRIESLVGRLAYNFEEKYNITLTARRDGSSRFGAGNKYGVFPSAAAAWNVHQESFFPQTALDLLKLRVSYGLSGNDNIADPNQTSRTLALRQGRTPTIQNYAALPRATLVSYAFGNTFVNGYTIGSLGNSNLKWETSKTLNAGLDFGLLNDRITGSFEYYQTNTSDLLLNRLVLITNGESSMLANIGKTKSWGFEFDIEGKVINKGPFRWTSGVNWSMDRNKIVALTGAADASGKPVDDIANGWFIDKPINVIYDYEFDGIWQLGQEAQAAAVSPAAKPGDVRVKDLNGPDGKPDGVINSTYDRKIIGRTTPDWYGGWRNTFTYKGLELTILLETVQGILKYNGYYGSLQGRDNQVKVNYWTPTNPSNEFPQPDRNNGDYRYKSASTVRDASFVALRNVSLAYNLPASLFKTIPVKGLSLYIRGNNLKYWTDYKDAYSPEVDAYRFPTVKTWNFGIRASF